MGYKRGEQSSQTPLSRPHNPSTRGLAPGRMGRALPGPKDSLGWHTSLGAQQGGGPGCLPTSFDCLMVRRGIHTVPTMVSQMSPLFHTSTVRPRSSRLISLGTAKGSG